MVRGVGCQQCLVAVGRLLPDENAYEHLLVLVADVGNPGSRPGRTARKLSGGLLHSSTEPHRL